MNGNGKLLKTIRLFTFDTFFSEQKKVTRHEYFGRQQQWRVGMNGLEGKHDFCEGKNQINFKEFFDIKQIFYTVHLYLIIIPAISANFFWQLSLTKARVEAEKVTNLCHVDSLCSSQSITKAPMRSKDVSGPCIISK